MREDQRLGQLLIRAGLINDIQLQKALDEQKIAGGLLGSNLVKLGFIGENALLGFLSKQYRVPTLDISKVKIVPEILDLIPFDVIQKHQVLPVSRTGRILVLAMTDPSNVFAIDDVKFLTGYKIDVVIATEESIKAAIAQYFDPVGSLAEVISDFNDDEFEIIDDKDEVDVQELQKATSEAPVVKLVNMILMEAIKRRASDVHLECYEKMFRVRFRIDGVLHEIMRPPVKLRNAITSRVKIMSELDIAERRLPQDGRVKLKMSGGREMDFRVSVLPTLYGEKIVLRLLDKSSLQLDMTKLGFEVEQLQAFQNAIHQPYGMVLVTGPTGSGKTTTLYSALSELNTITENISTAEDPVEFDLTGINQVQMREEIGLTFAAALRSFLRQDPDIIMVGEVRDFETAEIAIKAALTGHLVLSTLHTNDAPGTINRLLNMGVEPFLVTSAVNLILAQRLGRKICSDCKEPLPVKRSVLIEVGVPSEEIKDFKVYNGLGCDTCHGTGYHGRVALYEVMPVSDEMREMILDGASSTELKRRAREEGMLTLRESGLHKARDGVISLDEVLRVTAPDQALQKSPEEYRSVQSVR